MNSAARAARSATPLSAIASKHALRSNPFVTSLQTLEVNQFIEESDGCNDVCVCQRVSRDAKPNFN